MKTLRATLAARALAGLVLLLAWGPSVAGGVQALVNGLETYARSGDAGALQARLHPRIRDCVPDVTANTIARFVLNRVSKQGVADNLETRRVSPSQVEALREEARRFGLTMPVAPQRELRLVYDDYTARLFLAADGEQLRWVLPCKGAVRDSPTPGAPGRETARRAPR